MGARNRKISRCVADPASYLNIRVSCVRLVQWFCLIGIKWLACTRQAQPLEVNGGELHSHLKARLRPRTNYHMLALTQPALSLIISKFKVRSKLEWIDEAKTD